MANEDPNLENEVIATVRKMTDSLRGIPPQIRRTVEIELMMERVGQHCTAINIIASERKDVELDALAAEMREQYQALRGELDLRMGVATLQLVASFA